MPVDDPVVQEIRRIRAKHAASMGHDPKRIFEDLRKRQAASGRRYVRYAPRRVRPQLSEPRG